MGDGTRVSYRLSAVQAAAYRHAGAQGLSCWARQVLDRAAAAAILEAGDAPAALMAWAADVLRSRRRAGGLDGAVRRL